MKEFWKVIPQWETYDVSRSGHIRNRYTAKILKTGIRSGYRYVVLCHNDRRHKSAAVHRFVAAAFCEKPSGKMEVNHRDGNKLNNHAENLEWVTRSQNQIHATTHNLKRNGTDSHLWRKLNPEDVLAIRRLAGTGLSQLAIGKQFNISQTYVHKIVHKKKWRHL